MASFAPPIHYENAMGTIVVHSDGYALVSYYKVKWDLTQLRVFLEKLGSVLLLRGWQRILVDMRQIEPLSATEKLFLIEEWYSRKIARPS